MRILFEQKICDIAELQILVENTISLVLKYKVVFLVGDLGAGKTTLIQHYSKELGVEQSVTSPTFGYVNEYQSPSGIILHFDLYRLEAPEELYDIGFEDFISSNGLMFIEWPELAGDYFEEYLQITIERLDNCRKFRFEEIKNALL